MAAADLIHDAVKNALIKDGWTITHDPYVIKYEEVTLHADLGAERAIAAELAGTKIVVEIKSFVSHSFIQDIKTALGQYNLYLGFLEVLEPDRKLYLAISQKIYDRFFTQKAIQFIVQRYQLPLIIVNVEKEEIVKWTKPLNIAN
ncbi:XisH family protein [candidate division KSB1 bacterium]|nr:XisH family protein [candidate division KSB1 bacterium]